MGPSQNFVHSTSTPLPVKLSPLSRKEEDAPPVVKPAAEIEDPSIREHQGAYQRWSIFFSQLHHARNHPFNEIFKKLNAMVKHDQKIAKGEKPAKEEDDKLKKDLNISAEEKKEMYI